MSEIDKCIKFLTNNGWKFSFNDYDEDEGENCSYYDKPNCFSVSIDFNRKSITFFDDSGDIYHCKINIYTLIGFLFHYRQIACNYKYWNNNP